METGQALDMNVEVPSKLKWGSVAGFFYVLASYIMYFILKDARCVMLPFTLIPYSIPLAIGFLTAWLTLKVKNELSFRDALSTIFSVMIWALVFYGVYEWTLFNKIDVNLYESYKRLTIKFYEGILQGEQLDMMRNNILSINTVTVTDTLQSFVFSIIKAFFASVVLALPFLYFGKAKLK
ncbi:MAG: DUF4199 family protein [Chitinophagales bacterium]|jgi:hypothetical protein|nr:DUF4199 family protein [Chitinophagales bacterium]